MYYTTVFFSNRLSHFRGQAVVKNFITADGRAPGTESCLFVQSC
jgi:hypothetical protein